MAVDVDGIRAYCQYLSDPSSLRDDDAVAAAQRDLDAAEGVFDRAIARGALNRASQVDVAALRAVFVRDAKAWAAEHDITADDLAAEGVPEADLRAAGMRGLRPAPNRPRRSRTSMATIETAAAAMTGPFTVAELIDASGASHATVRKAIAVMLDKGTLADLGTDGTHAGRGRAPTRYQSR